MKFSPRESAEYYIRREFSSKKRAEFTIAKFDGTVEPTATYMVTVTKAGVTCNCPAYLRPEVKKPCRHMQMVARWVRNGDKDAEANT